MFLLGVGGVSGRMVDMMSTRKELLLGNLYC
jgi:hypothetical protein